MYGRRVLHFKVCSCPKRDKDKEEQLNTTIKMIPKKRKNDCPAAPSTSKKVAMMPIIKLESDKSMSSVAVTETPEPMAVEQNLCEVRMLLPNEAIKSKVLHAAYDILAGELHRSRDGQFEKFIKDIKSQIDELE